MEVNLSHLMMEFKILFLNNYVQILGIFQTFNAKVNLEGFSSLF